MRRVLAEFGRVRIFQVHHVSGEFDRRALQAEADAEEGNVPLSSETDRFDLAGDASFVEAARDEDAIEFAEGGRSTLSRDVVDLSGTTFTLLWW